MKLTNACHMSGDMYCRYRVICVVEKQSRARDIEGGSVLYTTPRKAS